MTRPPLWMYWEGPKNPWIEACLELTKMHHPEVRLLGPEEWEEIWDEDRDIDLGRFAIMHKADFIRGWLLSRHGGLWMDADCILQRRLDWVLDACGFYDFASYRLRPLLPRRNGRYTNALMGGRAGSPTMVAYYERTRARLKTATWTRNPAFGPNVLSEVVRETIKPGVANYGLDLPRRLFHPHLWDQKRQHWAHRSDEEHEAVIDPDIFMYMVTHLSFNLKKDMTSEQVWNSRMMLSYMLRRGRDNALASQE